MKRILLAALLLKSVIFTWTNIQAQGNNADFDIKQMKPIIKENGLKWGRALRENDITLINDLYDQNAHYLPDGENSIHGRDAISQYWASSFGFLNDLKLHMETLEGSKDLLYETGNGYVLMSVQNGKNDTQRYKYANVWKLNQDGKHRVVLDIFNDASL